MSVGLLLAGLVAIGARAAEPFPNHQMRIVAPFPPGGTVDLLARIAGQQLTAALGQQVVIENRTGAGGNIGGEIVAKAPPDGYTMLLGSTGLLSINPTIYHTMPFDPARDLAPVARLATVPNLMVINPDLPVHSVAEFIAYAKARPGKVFFASAGAGTTIHLSGELFKKMAGIDIVHTPYRGSAPALADLMAGQVQVMFDNMPSALPLAQSGKLRALAVTTETRAPSVPDLPTVAESGLPGYETSAWFGILVPAATPPDVVDTLSRALNHGMALPDVRQKLANVGATASPDTPDAFRAFIAAETAKWSQLARDAHVTVD
ncbi:MAG TPA: tripartite tricarboxylate transporter substrate binding protein [Candidatus Sulfotelmatobacter sp.]|nr:tripartite tricarboxylate transporter substrate binding protein [Candidatus Sulfotelmatobacter sp.]